MLEIEIEILKSTNTVQTAPALPRLHSLSMLCLNTSSPDFKGWASKKTQVAVAGNKRVLLVACDSSHRACRLFRGGFLGGGGYTRWNRTVWVVRSGVFEMKEAGCGARVKSLSTWLRILGPYPRKRASMVKALPPVSKYPHPALSNTSYLPTRSSPFSYLLPRSQHTSQPSFSQLPRLRLKLLFLDSLTGCLRALELGTIGTPPGDLWHTYGGVSVAGIDKTPLEEGYWELRLPR